MVMEKQQTEKKNIRLIGLDLDGTTLTSQKELTPHRKNRIGSPDCARS